MIVTVIAFAMTGAMIVATVRTVENEKAGRAIGTPAVQFAQLR